MRPNQLVSIVGVALIVIALGAGAIIGDKLQPRTEASSGKALYEVTWGVVQMNLPAQGGTVADGATQTVQVPVFVENLTDVSLQLSSVDHPPFARPGATLTVTVTNGTGAQVGTASGAAGQTVSVDWSYAPAPEPLSFTAGSKAAAWAHLEAVQPAQTEAGDDYTVTIEESRGGLCPPIIGCLRQGNVDFQITIISSAYNATITAASPAKDSGPSEGSH